MRNYLKKACRLRVIKFSLLSTLFFVGINGCGGSDGDDSSSGTGSEQSTTIINSTLYGGGPLYFGGQRTMDELKHSGFTTINFWTIHVESNGDLVYNDQLIVRDGTYVGRDSWPNEIASLKETPTSIDRIQFGVASYGVPDFERIQSIIEAEGTGTDSILYKNFKALKSAIPAIDAIDFDDESNYHVDSAAKFGVMLGDLGYKISFVPYTARSFWADLYKEIEKQRPGVVDRIQIQAYAGGAGNQPSMWNDLFGDLKVSMGLWSKNGNNCHDGDTPNEAGDALRGWKDDISGGFIWLYDDVKKCGGSIAVAQYASAINEALGINETSLSKAEQPLPANDDISIETSTTLAWDSGLNAESHDVYLSQNSELTSEDLIASQNNTNIIVSDLLPATTYYWRVDEKNQNSTVKGDLWSFTTKREGYIALDLTDSSVAEILARGENYPNEIASMAFDNNAQTKWLDFSANSWIQVHFSNNSKYTIKEYTFTSANDSPERDPKDWVLKASNDGENWQILDTKNSQYFTERFEKRRFMFSNTEPYSYYLIEMNNHGGGIMQIGEIELIEYIQE